MLSTALLLTVIAIAQAEPEDPVPRPQSPNVVLILCDDLGYGDVHGLSPSTSKIPTPGADRLIGEGMAFTDAHSGSSVCTPTRYGILTGRYAWRTSLQKGVVTGFAPCLIPAERPTLATFLKGQGYDTAIVGKWHLNFRYVDPESGDDYPAAEHKTPPVGALIPDGPLARGFDAFHGFHHARNMEAVIDGDRVIAHDEPIHMLPRLAARSARYIASRTDAEQPFFLYVPLGSPHTPILPTKAWQGRSGLGAYGDFVMETDDAIARILEALDEHGLSDNTLVILSSDNGTSRAAKIGDLRKQGHLVSAQYRGSKADIWDGGHRIPFIVRWPGVVQAGTRSSGLVCLGDLFATLADALGEAPPEGSCEDSLSFLPLLREPDAPAARTSLVHHSVSGHFAYRRDRWKLILARGSGGWSGPNEKKASQAGAPIAQLYDMESDPGEQTNLWAEKPELRAQLLQELQGVIDAGSSRPGCESSNDVESIELWKSGRDG